MATLEEMFEQQRNDCLVELAAYSALPINEQDPAELERLTLTAKSAYECHLNRDRKSHSDPWSEAPIGWRQQ